ncbi:transposase [Streptomyces europaeiscabiei]|uniref:transposase n=1 Tax=Streptomyces europaeiscabiei TaxID=146819 RepID=UPI0038D36E7B
MHRLLRCGTGPLPRDPAGLRWWRLISLIDPPGAGAARPTPSTPRLPPGQRCPGSAVRHRTGATEERRRASGSAADAPVGEEASLAALCGVSPVEKSSGKSQRRRLNRGGDRQANAALHRIVVTRLPSTGRSGGTRPDGPPGRRTRPSTDFGPHAARGGDALDEHTL